MPFLLLIVGLGVALWFSSLSPDEDSSATPAASSNGDGSLLSLIRSYALKHGVDPSLAAAVAKQESGVKQYRGDGSVVTSSAGAIGVFQLMPGTAQGLGVDPYDLEQNVDGGTLYLSQLLTRYGGDSAKALAAYNWGLGRVDSAVTKYGDAWNEHLPNETSNYLDSILGAVGMQ